MLIRAARYLGTTPWELARQPAIWRDWALLAEGAEASAEQAKSQKSLSKR